MISLAFGIYELQSWFFFKSAKVSMKAFTFILEVCWVWVWAIYKFVGRTPSLLMNWSTLSEAGKTLLSSDICNSLWTKETHSFNMFQSWTDLSVIILELLVFDTNITTVMSCQLIEQRVDWVWVLQDVEFSKLFMNNW
jgi:hypothetical protein